MRNTEEDRGFYGYEGYKVMQIWHNVFLDTNNRWVVPSYDVHEKYIASVWYPVQPSDLNYEGFLNLHIQEHPELLAKAKKVYTNPSCTLPRESIIRKYKRCLNAVQADVVVIPNPANSIVWCGRNAVFTDEKRKVLLYASFENQYSTDSERIAAYNRILQFPKGTLLADIVHPNIRDAFMDSFPNAKLAETGYYGEFTAKDKYLVDYMEMLIPSKKIVFQETLSNELNDETNRSSFETFMSIHDMLMSTDKEIRNVGLKTLATMDYANFRNSAFLVLRDTVRNWKNDYKARNSTGVKYMMKILGITYPTERAMQFKDVHIRKEDFEIFQRLWTEFNYNKSSFRHLPFMYYDVNCNMIPRLLPDDNQ